MRSQRTSPVDGRRPRDSVAPAAGGAGAQAQYADDGAKQNAAGGWDPDWGFCAQDPPPGPGERDAQRLPLGHPERRHQRAGQHLLEPGVRHAERVHRRAPNPLPPGGPAEWNSGFTCTNYWFRRSQSVCEANGGMWLNNVCRGRWRWDPEAPVELRGELPRQLHPLPQPEVLRTTKSWGIGETYVMTGHKNMLRPVAPSGNTDPHYTTTYPWAGSDGIGLRDRLERQPDRLRDRDGDHRRRAEDPLLDLRRLDRGDSALALLGSDLQLRALPHHGLERGRDDEHGQGSPP